jgi:uncharacterized membrane protein YfcA
MIPDTIWMGLVTFCAAVLKATTGIGSAMVLVPAGALFLGSVQAVVLEAVLDGFGGCVLLAVDRERTERRGWLHMAGPLIAGTLLGAYLLSRVPVPSFDLILGIMLLVLAIWLLAGRPGLPSRWQSHSLGDHPAREAVVCGLAGLLGGATGISGPPLIVYFGATMEKGPFRRVVTLLFLIDSIARIVSYALTGLLHASLLPWLVLSLPAMLLGILLGNRIFGRIPTRRFPQLLGLVVLMVALHLLG